MPTIDKATLLRTAKGQWHSILATLGLGQEYLTDKHGPLRGAPQTGWSSLFTCMIDRHTCVIC